MTDVTRSVGRGAGWTAPLALLAALLVSTIRGLGNPSYGPLPALGALEPVKFIDPLLLFVLGGLAILHAVARGTWTIPEWKIRWGACIAIIACIGFVGALAAGAPPYFAAQSLLFVLRPALLLLVLTGFSWARSAAPRLWTIVVWFSLANAGLVLAQWWFPGATTADLSADAISGLLHDAHQQATFAYTVAVLSLSRVARRSTWRRRMLWACFCGLNAFAGFLSQGQKATGIVIGVVLMAAVVGVLRSRARLTRVAALLPATALVALVALPLTAGTLLWTDTAIVVSGNLRQRLQEGGYGVVTFLGDLGVVQMFEDFEQLSADDARVLFMGVGPSNFGSPAALTRVNSGDAPRRSQELFWREATKEEELVAKGELRLLGLSAKTSILGVLLGEYGCIALLAFLYLLVWPLFLVPRHAHDGSHVDAARSLFWLKVAYLGLVLQAMLSTLGAWDNDVVMTILIAGFADVLASREHAPSEAWLSVTDGGHA